MTKTIKQMDAETQSFAMQQIIRAGDIIQSSFYEREERLIKLLLFLSAGGIVAMLTYMYHLKTPSVWWFISLICFFLALAFSFSLVVRDYYAWKGQLCRFSDDAELFQTNKISWEKILHFVGNKGSNAISPICRRCAASFIWLGILLGICCYINNSFSTHKHSPNDKYHCMQKLSAPSIRPDPA